MEKGKLHPQTLETRIEKAEKLIELYEKYQQKRKRTVFDQQKRPIERIQEYIIKVAVFLEEKGFMFPQRELQKIDCIDIANAANPYDFCMDDDKNKMLNDNWYLAIPPLKSGVLRENYERKICFEIGDIHEENKSYDLRLNTYGKIDGIWIIDAFIKARVEIAEKGIINHELGIISLPAIIESTLKNMEGLNDDDRLFCEMVMIPYERYVLTKTDLREFAEGFLSSFVTEITCVNIQLLNEKPKAKRVKRNPHKAIASEEVETQPRPQIIRNMSSGIVIKSRVVPKAPTEESVRRYKLAAWNTRGHVRHYKTGVTVYIKPSVHHRKCLKDKGIEVVPQTIIEIT